MKKETNLPRIQALARSFLMLEIGLTQYSPIIVQHPFTSSGVIACPNATGHLMCMDITKDEDALAKWRQEVKEQINRAKSVGEIYMKLNQPYCLVFLKYARPDLSSRDFSRLLSDAWIQSEYPNEDPSLTQQQLLSLFRSADPSVLMNSDEYAAWNALPDTITVYRGVTSYNAENIRRMSWTLDRKTAEWFAHRFGEQGTVYQARIPKDSVYAFFGERNVSEVIVDPKYLIGITAIQSEEIGSDQTNHTEYEESQSEQDGEMHLDM